MLKTVLHWNFKDVFRAPRLGLGKRMLVMLEANLIGYLVYLVLIYLGQMMDGQSFSQIWSQYALLPFMPFWELGPSTGIAGYVAAIVWFMFVYTGMGAVAKITIKEFKGDLFYSSNDGWKYALKKSFPIFMGPISILLVVAFFVILAGVFGWLAQWPVLDIILYGLLFVLFLPTAVFLIYSLFSFTVGALFSPSIVTCAEEDTMGSMFGSFTLLWNQPWRLILYTLLLLVLTFIGYHVLLVFLVLGFQFLEFVFGQSWLMGDTYFAVKSTVLSLFPNLGFNHVVCYPNCVYGEWMVTLQQMLVGNMHVVTGGVTTTITGVIVGIFSFIAMLMVPSYALSTFGSGLATIFIVLTKFKDDDDLIERKDEDERKEEEEEEDEESDEADDLDLDNDGGDDDAEDTDDSAASDDATSNDNGNEDEKKAE